MTLRTTCDALSASLSPFRPTAPAMMMLGVMLMLRVTRRRSQGRSLQFKAPSLTICPAMVQTMPAETPESSRASAKMVPAAGEMDSESSLWMLKMSASGASGLLYKDTPATMRMAELTNRANVKSAVASSADDTFSECRMALSDGT